MKFSIHVIDDEKSIREGISMSLESDYTIETFATAEKALEIIKERPPDLVLLDIGLPGIDGIEALRRLKGMCPDIQVIMITAYEDIDTVITAMKLGAYDYVVKPLRMDGLEVTIHNALETIRLRKELRVLQEKYLQENLPCFIAESNEIKDVMEFISLVAKSPDTPILIHGETGTGKELIASAIHYRSPHFKAPLVALNCAALPKELIESELFGYEKGAFSGAGASGKKGLVEESDGGTLFLDEVGDLSLNAQAKLLRFLEDGQFYRIGGTKKLQVNTRVVSATNKDLLAMIKKDLFRKDLYFRLSVITINIPSLNERKDDIIPLANHFLSFFSQKFGKKISSISPEAKKTLLNHNWTGNVRELRNIIERGALIAQGNVLTHKDLGIEEKERHAIFDPEANKPVFPELSLAGIDLEEAKKTFERFYIEAAMDMAGENESEAARLLKMNHHTFRYRRKKLL